jgi:tetratricopeptide (TPR) repeat protein
MYVRMFVIPVGQNIDHDVPLSRTIWEPGAFGGFIALVSLVLVAHFQRRRYRIASYGVFVFLILLAPTSSIIPIRDVMVEHRLYLPFVGLLIVMIGLLARWEARFSTLVAVLTAVLAVEGSLTFARNRFWGDAIAMWRDSTSKSPRKVRPRFALAYALYQAGRCGEALHEFQRAAELETPAYGLLVDWALAFDCLENRPAAIAKLKAAAALQETAHVYSQIGVQYAKAGLYPEALRALDHAAGLDPNFEITYVYRGHVYASRAIFKELRATTGWPSRSMQRMMSPGRRFSKSSRRTRASRRRLRGQVRDLSFPRDLRE